MDILCKGKATPSTLHPAEKSRKVFLAFDQSHIIKNVRSQFFCWDIGGNKQISLAWPKLLYKMH
ncbi:hypothetical protein HPB48_020499 [Haemaphysalis longicornis]|uniref:Transposase n=1 Tax=Haemaphysalis longicornis TaxID=44386 RepID=A0A9J6G9A8_HAELO|nr:hypothetical protein HPB48_020499 [Haemaphysalis longicornis]